LGSVGYIYQLLTGGSKGPNTYPDSTVGQLADVRDIAKAHVLATRAPPLTDGRNKRFIVVSKSFTWPEIADLIRKERPRVAHRLPSKDAEVTKTTEFKFDLSLTENVLGLRELIPWQQTVLENVDLVLEWEKMKSE
jgi:nucleoside-diphosphate-sugar epimerase